MVKKVPAPRLQPVKESWKNRIIGTGEETPENLLANPKNWRLHPKAQQEGLEEILDRVGWVQNVIVNQRTGFLADGHLRVTLAMRRNEPRIPVVYVDLSQEEEDIILASLDPLAALGRTDLDKLKQLIADVAEIHPDMSGLLERIAQDSGALPIEKQDAKEHWDGMPEFMQENLLAFRQLIVNFTCEDDWKAFFKLVEQKGTDKTKSIWFPKQTPAALKEMEIR